MVERRTICVRTGAEPEEVEPVFLRVEVEVASSPAPALAAAPAGGIEIELPDGCRISAEGNFDGDALGRMLKALAP